MFIIAILSIIQGISEFLPISSSAHLLVTPWLFGWADPGLGFDAAIHIGTAVALFAYFYKDFWKLYRQKSPLLAYLVFATIPGATLGLLGDKLIEAYLHDSSYAPLIVGLGMIIFSFLLLYVDSVAKLRRTTEQMTLKDSLFVGFAQALALVPGTSRSGITITAGLWRGLKREDAARFSFLLAAPISLGAGLYKTYDLVKHPQPNLSITMVLVGIIISGVVGMAVIRWLLKYLGTHNMRLFVWYRIGFGVLVALLWLLRR